MCLIGDPFSNVTSDHNTRPKQISLADHLYIYVYSPVTALTLDGFVTVMLSNVLNVENQ